MRPRKLSIRMCCGTRNSKRDIIARVQLLQKSASTVSGLMGLQGETSVEDGQLANDLLENATLVEGQQELFDMWRSPKLLEVLRQRLRPQHVAAIESISAKLLVIISTTITSSCIAKLSDKTEHHTTFLRLLQQRPAGDIEYMHLGLLAIGGDDANFTQRKSIEHIQGHAILQYVEHLFKGSIDSFASIAACLSAAGDVMPKLEDSYFDPSACSTHNHKFQRPLFTRSAFIDLSMIPLGAMMVARKVPCLTADHGVVDIAKYAFERKQEVSLRVRTFYKIKAGDSNIGKSIWDTVEAVANNTSCTATSTIEENIAEKSGAVAALNPNSRPTSSTHWSSTFKARMGESQSLHSLLHPLSRRQCRL